METAHQVYLENGELYKSFTASEWYDTATPAQYCLKELNEIWNAIQAGQRFYIDSTGNRYTITSVNDFRDWLANVFGAFADSVGGG